MSKKPEEYTSVQKAIEILLAFVDASYEVGTVELSEKLGLHKSTVSRLMHLLNHYGLIQKNKKTKKYILGKSALDLGMTAKRYIDSQMIITAQTYLYELRDMFGEMVSLEVISGNSSTVVCHAESTLPVRVSTDIGRRLPVYAVAGAKAIVAFLPSQEIDELLTGKLNAYTPNTITNPNKFRRHLQEIRTQGYSLDHGEYYADVHAIGAPIFNADRRPVAAVVMPVPAFRMDSVIQNNGVELVKQTAFKISSSLFFEG